MYPRGYLREHSSLLLWLMRLLDLLVSLTFCFIAYYLVFRFKPLLPHYQVAVLFSVLVVVLIFHLFDLYRTWRGVDYIQEVGAVIMAWTTVFAILAFLSVITKTSADFSRAWLVMWYTFGGLALLLIRFLLRYILRRMRAQGFNLRHIVIIGSGDIGTHVLETITQAPESGFHINSYFSDQPSASAPENAKVGQINDGLAYLQQQPDIDQIWLAMPLSDSDRIQQVLDTLKNTTVDIRLIPDLFGFRLINHSISTIAGMSVINLSVTPMDGINKWMKAVEDKMLSFLILLLISPLLLVIAVLIKLSSPGPILFRQNRLSWNGREFAMLKFRTMPVDTEADSGPVWATSGENRATPLGAFLRRTSLDELPQFWNVLKGDMSIVGPRPERKVFVEQFADDIPSYMQKHMVKAGITGWAQVNGWRGDTDLKKRIEHDLYYIDNWSLWLDLKIILMTVFKGFVHKNAY